MRLKRIVAAALAGTLATALPAAADEVVIATTGGLMRNTLEKLVYRPFAKATGTEIVPFDIEVPDQWARAEGMVRTKRVEFDIVTATGPDLVSRADMLMDIPCGELAHVKEYALPGACQPKGVARTTGGMVLTYNKTAFGGRTPKSWADFWNVKDFPGLAACRIPATATGGCPRWPCSPTACRRTGCFPSTSIAPTPSSTGSAPPSPCGGRPATRSSRSCATARW